VKKKTRGGAHRAAVLRGVWAAVVSALAAGSAWSSCKLNALEIPVRMVGSRPIATVGLNGTEAPMLVDSGAFFSLLTESTAAQLKLPLRMLPNHMRVDGYTGAIDASLTRVSQVRFGGAELHNVEFIVGGNELGAGILGVLGRNFLSFADTEYDLAHGVVRLVVPKGDCDEVNYAYWAKGAPVNVMPLHQALDHDTALRVDARINDVEVSALLDSGAGQTSLKRSTARRAGVKDEQMVPLGRVGGAGAGHAKSWIAPVALVQLGGEKIANNRLEVDDADGTDEDMLLGIDYFLSHRIYVSHLQRKVYATWNGGAVFAQNKANAADEALYAAAPQAVAPDDADALARRGEAAASRHAFTQALDDLNQACALQPARATCFRSRARVHLAMGHLEPALADLDESLRLDPALHDARLVRARLRLDRGDREGALADLQVLDTALPEASHFRTSMGAAYAQMKLVPEALRQWDLWVAHHEEDANLGEVLNDRCWLRARMKVDLPKALEDCKAAVKADEENPHFHDSLGWTYLRLDQPKAARVAFDKAIALDPKKSFSYYGRALARRRAGDAEGAVQDVAAARKLDAHVDAAVQKAGFEAEPAAGS
jgi:predicted aspartyl protease/Tfp pilus assembly protein PilF